MEGSTPDSCSNNAELNSLLSQFQALLQNANQISSLMKKQDYCELRSYHNFPNQILYVFAAALYAVSNIKIRPISTASLKPKIAGIQDFAQLVKSFDIENLYMNNDQITYIQNIYTNNPDLKNQLRPISTFACRLSEWVEVYVEISITGNRIKELKGILGIN